MGDAYAIHEAQFLQWAYEASAADALQVSLAVVPAHRVQTVFKAFGSCSVAGIQDYWFAVKYNNYFHPVTLPASFSLDPVVYEYYPLLREGMELKLWPGEQLTLCRADKTAGSTIAVFAQYVESDIQYYVELDKHKVLRRRMDAMQESSSGMPSIPAGLHPSYGGRPRDRIGVFTRYTR